MSSSDKGSASPTKNSGQIVKVDDAQVKAQLGELVRGTVEETLNAIEVNLEDR